ncbi:MAG: hypothetical protein J6J13_06770 [Clostridia bacterium]|nr:hypothetical protein [Clostridia bacterium]
MRKKQLLNQNISLFEQLQREKANNMQLIRENERLKEKNSQLKNALENLGEDIATQVTPLQKIEQKVVESAVDSQTQYACDVIGKVVVSSAEYSNKLTDGGETRYIELVNLILGRAEVAKAEILSLVLSDDDFSIKKEKMDTVLEKTQEYFKSIMAQRF